MGRIQSLDSSAAVTPTAIASWPIPENHFESLPCRRSSSAFSSMRRGTRSA